MAFSRSGSMLSIFAPTLSRPRTYKMSKSSKWSVELVIHAYKHRTHLVNIANTPSIAWYPFRQRRLARINMRRDTNVSLEPEPLQIGCEVVLGWQHSSELAETIDKWKQRVGWVVALNLAVVHQSPSRSHVGKIDKNITW